MTSRRKPGLWFRSISIEVENVTPAQKKLCAVCNCLPQERRLVVDAGAGRRITTTVYCMEDGRAYLHRMSVEAERAKAYLSTGEGEIRSL